MKRLLTLTAVAALGLLYSAATAEEYDFFGRARYPGPVKAPGVDLYKVEQGGGADPKAYERREVVWWPRKGVDIIEVQQARGRNPAQDRSGAAIKAGRVQARDRTSRCRRKSIYKQLVVLP